MAHALARAHAQEGTEVAIHGRPGQDFRQQQVLLPAIGAQQVEQAVQQVAHVGRPRAPLWAVLSPCRHVCSVSACRC